MTFGLLPCGRRLRWRTLYHDFSKVLAFFMLFIGHDAPQKFIHERK